jgi:hypothetical protein
MFDSSGTLQHWRTNKCFWVSVDCSKNNAIDLFLNYNSLFQVRFNKVLSLQSADQLTTAMTAVLS